MQIILSTTCEAYINQGKMSKLIFEKSVIIKELLITNSENAKALGHPMRIAIIEILSHNSMLVQQIAEGLKKKKKIKNAPTRMRHLEGNLEGLYILCSRD